jgi:predicted dithiol-disulfide oxidoreductase (DUF899 family)
MVKIDKDYVFEGESGPARLVDLFEGRPQLIIYHFMFGPAWEKGCHRCAEMEDELQDASVGGGSLEGLCDFEGRGVRRSRAR